MITKKDLYFYNLSLELSKISLCKNKHGCIITHKSKPLVLAVNKPKINTIKTKYKLDFNELAEARRSRQQTTHAEISAILKTRKTCLDDTVLYSAHGLKNGDSGSSYPCAGCLQAILICNIKYIVYWDNGLKKISTRNL